MNTPPPPLKCTTWSGRGGAWLSLRLLRRLGHELPLLGHGGLVLLAVPRVMVGAEVVGALGRWLPARLDGAALACMKMDRGGQLR